MVVPHQPPDEPREPKRPAEPRPSPRRPVTAAAALPVINPDAAGIDVHSDMHMVCGPAGRDPEPVRRSGADTADLHEIAAWLKRCGITTVAMESTGVYWIPLYELLESEGFEVKLVEPGQLARCGARPKTDVLDAQWIQRLHSYGLLRGSFRPPDAVLALRSYWRRRMALVRDAAGHVQHMQKALEQMNVKLTEVVSSIVGVTGMAILAAILAGERDPAKLARLRDPRCRRDEAEIALALEGTWRQEHLFALRQAHDLYQFLHRQIDECDRRIEAELKDLPDRSEGKPREERPRLRGRKSNDVRFEAEGPLARAPGVDLTAIPGIDVGTALVILAEIGPDVSRFPSEKHFAGWLRLCPPQDRSNKTDRRRRGPKGAGRASQALRMAARAVGRTMTPLGLFYRRIKSRIGGLGAVKATAHKLACLIYRMLRHGQEYVVRSLEEYETKLKASLLESLERKAAALGYELSPRPAD
jgi:transposase